MASAFGSLRPFEKVPLTRPTADDGDATFDALFRSSATICLLFTQAKSAPCKTFLTQLAAFVQHQCKSDQPVANGSRRKFGSSPNVIRRIFSNGKKKPKKTGSPCESAKRKVNVLVICLDDDADDFEEVATVCRGWWMLPFDQRSARRRLMRACLFGSAPALAVADAASWQLLAVDGRRALADDPSALGFPWPTPAYTSSLRGAIWANGQQQPLTTRLQYAELECVKALLFAAKWCPPCRAFVEQLRRTYDAVRAAGHKFEVVFCSTDQSAECFGDFFATMPWTALTFDADRLRQLARGFNINGIPALIILDEADNVINRNGRNAVLADPAGSNFPWRPPLVDRLNEFSLSRLREEQSLVLFVENGDETALAVDIMTSVALDEAQDGGGERLQLFVGDADSAVGAQVLDALCGADCALPLACIVDAFDRRFWLCDQPDVSDAVLRAFVADVRADRLVGQRLPSTGATDGPRRVGGIPVEAIAAALRHSSSSSLSSAANNNNAVDSADLPNTQS